MTILITGSSGFIGKRFTQLLKTKNISYKTIGRSEIDDFYCDFENDPIDPNIFNGIDLVVHAAGYAHDVNDSAESKRKHHALNFLLTKELLIMADERRVKKFIFLSSVKAGGKEINNKKIHENSLDYDFGPYSKSKRDSENFLLNYESVNNLEKIIIRPSLVYGKNMKGNLNLMLKFIEKGIFPPLPDTKQRKALVHVDDVARSILFLSKNRKLNNEIFCLTDGNFYSPKDIYDSLLYATGGELKNWNVPFFIFKIFSFIPYLNKPIKKIFVDEPYASDKIQSLGFRALFGLKQINEKAF